jgi:hypothetical protein
MSLVNYPIFESPIVLFETEKGEYAGVFEGNNIIVKLNKDYFDNNTKYSVYFLNALVGLDELPNCWEVDYR